MCQSNIKIYFYIKTKMNTSNYDFIKTITDFESNVIKAQEYIKENYNVDSEFNIEKSELHLKISNINESLMLCAAKEYVNNTIGEDHLHVVMG